MDTRSPVQHALVLHKVDPDHGVARFYSLRVERDLFGTIRLVRKITGPLAEIGYLQEEAQGRSPGPQLQRSNCRNQLVRRARW
jgi:hypothetical protein